MFMTSPYVVLTALPDRTSYAALAAADAYTLTPGRLWTVVSGVLVLGSLVAGGLALARATGRRGGGSGRRASLVAVVTGLTGVLVGGFVLWAADGGPGTGSGVVGGYLSVLVGMTGTGLGGLALVRARHTARPTSGELA